jgi:hypothetical protein
MSDEICECGHSKSAHYFAEGEPGHCVLACECTQFRPRKEVQKKYCRCGHTEEEHHRYISGDSLIRHCRVMGCSCDHFREERPVAYRQHTPIEKQLIREAQARTETPRPRVVFAWFHITTVEWGQEGPYEQWRCNPEDVSSISSTQHPNLTQVSMRNGQMFLVQGTVDEVQKKLQEV